MIEGNISEKFKFYTKETHVIDMETQGEEPGYVKNGGRNRDVVFYWRLMDEWKKETGPVRRGQYYRCLMDSQMDAQTPVNGWYVFRFNLTEDMKRGKALYSRDRDGQPRIVADTLKKINSIDVDASDCRIDDIKLIITKKKDQ